MIQINPCHVAGINLYLLLLELNMQFDSYTILVNSRQVAVGKSSYIVYS